ncbi:flagellar hook assembly protein FlgD [Sulfitobacter sp. R18_1]|uniref:flagellar hook assembly protein FlgD n=1 Tax=Sulfitobacter sp. R18_1 TaxID=2821104 RepID=UPI001ADD5A50|nr:flagellar hook assembly protein FlgD [Sulfitobacter sp. R18_1]MBO9428649.1 flagellar hook assembly protein FlgD [Sulfitobacter sp. R18_1]
MTISPTTAAANTQPTTKSGVAASKLDSDFQNFLQLLTAQIQHQDPMAPMDSTTFVTQLAQLSQVEQAVQTNGNLESINSLLGANGSLSDVSLIGKDVKTNSNRLNLNGDEARFEYELTSPTTSTRVEITDTEGNVVRTFNEGELDGDQLYEIVWDGKDDQGRDVGDGHYDVRISAKDAEDQTVKYNTVMTNKVKEVLFDGGLAYLHLNNGEVIQSGQLLSVS